ncbi:hypothetical protein [Xanthomonas sp. 10-10]|uniref:Integron gene cassette protein n=1 Tax=Xanthomonas sp. 10-10 TaxID=3115848 RepID=A0AAU7P8I3_9XANT
MKRLSLRSLPSSVLTEYTSVSKIFYEKNSCIVHLTAAASNRTVQIIFSDVVGVKILDERDFSEFWRCNMESFDEIKGAIVSQVTSGGWSQHDEILQSHVPTGFYGEVMEFFIADHYECINVLCAKEPCVQIVD